ncbi:MAG: hypothetical protein GY906_32190 [bacterium]|nr:hypothetical protein [bacterium]
MRTLRRMTGLLLLLPVVVLSLGCEDVTPTPAEQAAVEEVLTAYLDALADAYSNLDASGLEAVASRSEVHSVQQVLNTLASSGDRVEAILLGYEIERLDVFREVNATLRLTEIWDVARYDAYTGEEKVRNRQSVQTSIIQFRLMEGEWRITARRVFESDGESRWSVTPEPEAAQ